ncbi:MAG: hypothetical protein U0841_04455 [Chloroflexia bacterium]
MAERAATSKPAASSTQGPEHPQATSKADQAAQAAKTKRAQGIFPRLSLTKALELPRTIYEMGEGEPVRRLSVFDRLNRKPDSGPSRTLVAVCNTGYGLTTGSAVAERMEVTERGKALVAASDQATRLNAAYDALFSNDIFSTFVSRFANRSMPNDEVGRDYLQSTFNLQAGDAAAFFEVIKENVTEYGLIQELSGRQVLISRETAMENVGAPAPKAPIEKSNGSNSTPDLAAVINPQTLHIPTPQTPIQPSPLAPNRIEPQIHFNIQIQLPENASPETYNTIFKNIAIHLLGRGEE